MTPEHTTAQLEWIRDSKKVEAQMHREAAVYAAQPVPYLHEVNRLCFEVEALEQAVQDVAMNEKFARAIVEAQWSGDVNGLPGCPWCHAQKELRHVDVLTQRTMYTTANHHATGCIVREAQAALERTEKEKAGK